MMLLTNDTGERMFYLFSEQPAKNCKFCAPIRKLLFSFLVSKSVFGWSCVFLVSVIEQNRMP